MENQDINLHFRGTQSTQGTQGTQDVNDCFTQSQTQTQTQTQPLRPWGMLCPAPKSAFSAVEMTKDEYTFGRLDLCDICVKNKVEPRTESVISKIHFRIYREKYIGSNGVEDDIMYLMDESQNGTFVNHTLVGKGNKVVLVNNDLIAVARKTITIFVFMSSSGYDNSYLPLELKSQYAVSRTIGAGACGEVKMCYSKIGCKKFAMKIIRKAGLNTNGHKNQANDERHILNEVTIGKNLQHPCIIRVEDCIDSPTMVYIILELMEGGELFERIKKFDGLSEQNAKFIFYQVVLAVNYLHENGITHRDLKPENILLASDDDETIVKVSDFGLSKIMDTHTMMKTFCGTPMYVAPEVLLTNGRGAYTCQIDVWSLGVILYCCLSGITPFKIHDKVNDLYEQIVKGMYNFPASKFSHVSSAAKDLIKRMMTVNPTQRITIKKVLAHPWLRDPEMLSKVNRLLGLPKEEKILSPSSLMNDINVPPAIPKFKRARLE